MTINSSSWHLRLVRFFSRDYVPRDLCTHFWTVMWILATLLPLVLLMKPLDRWDRLLATKHENHHYDGIFHTTSGVPFIMLFVIIAPLVVPIWGATLLWVTLFGKRVAPSPKGARITEPSLMGEWLKAKKRRVCPLITLREDTG